MKTRDRSDSKTGLRDASRGGEQPAGTDLIDWTRRDALRNLAVGGAVLAGAGGVIGCAEGEGGEAVDVAPDDPVVAFDLGAAAPGASSVYPFGLPELPYGYDAIEAVVDARTMEIHHGKHHQGYTTKLNTALEGATELQGLTLFELLGRLEELPEAARTAIRNNGGGYLNHALFWPLLQPGGASQPEGDLADAIAASFGDAATFREEFAGAAKGLFGSGWAWLTADAAGGLEVRRYANQDTPLADGLRPVLGVDVWEHAYYLKYQNRRAEYVDNVLDAINWSQAAANFSA